MSDKPVIDQAAAHRFFSANCFNRTWDFLDKTERSADDERLMIALSLASIYHWMQRPDCTAKNLSVGYWQVSRVHAVLGLGAEALRYAEVCQSYSGELAPFYRGYAWEAVARAAAVSGDAARAIQAKNQALALLAEIPEEDRTPLAQDLATIPG